MKEGAGQGANGCSVLMNRFIEGKTYRIIIIGLVKKTKQKQHVLYVNYRFILFIFSNVSIETKQKKNRFEAIQYLVL